MFYVHALRNIDINVFQVYYDSIDLSIVVIISSQENHCLEF